jgi:hypothetical protein
MVTILSDRVQNRKLFILINRLVVVVSKLMGALKKTRVSCVSPCRYNWYRLRLVVKYLHKKGARDSKGERVQVHGMKNDAGFVLFPPILVVGDACGGLQLCDRVWEPSCTGTSSVQGIEENPMRRYHQGFQRRRRLVPEQNDETLVCLLCERVQPDG